MSTDELLEVVRDLAILRDAVLYDICFRNADVGLLWHEKSREVDPPSYATHSGRDAWRNGLVVYAYGETLQDALNAELRRMWALATFEQRAKTLAANPALVDAAKDLGLTDATPSPTEPAST